MFKALRWIAKQPVAAAKFVSRQAGTKTGRLALTAIATTAISQVGGENIAPHAPSIAETVVEIAANPTVATLTNVAMLALMYHRDRPLKDAQNKAAAAKARRKSKVRAK